MKPKDLEELLRDMRDHISYCPDAGVLRWKKRTAPQATAISIGAEVGCIDGQGYRTFLFRRRQYLAHRVAWALHYGEWPKEIDHKDGQKANNRIANLRDCSHGMNCHNRVNPVGAALVRGATWNQRAQKWQSQVKCNGASKHLGLFESREEAANAYWTAKAQVAGAFMRQERQ